ncbi:Aste57867_23915 [Aphanomyces stellatus]|uniref:Aste57867_23915 protein n=1 Tax=Aphanomyces stellatus TaxID=120398 RepID=A0A485LP02_9STRA|nr:hypothetical protein As57867_023842 [Aphanomyces stellatus]VFU00558.1 Aste57867_23915 [Aphanomyces stellatus]
MDQMTPQSLPRIIHLDFHWDNPFWLLAEDATNDDFHWDNPFSMSNLTESGANQDVLQDDGDLVLVQSDGSRVWTSKSAGQGKGPYCANGQLQIRCSDCGAIWSIKPMQ